MQSFCGEFFCKVDSEILRTETTYNSPICQAKHLSNYLEEKLNELFIWLEGYEFKNIEEEIFFFKELKSKLTSKYIYYHKILEIESKAPNTSRKLKIKYYKDVIVKCHQASTKDKEFYKYYRSGFTHYDHMYFTRYGTKQSINKHIARIYIDVRRCSLYDYNVALILANDNLIEFYEERIEELTNISKSLFYNTKSNLNWTGTKVDLIELVYALHASKAINHGNNDIKEIAMCLGRMLNVDIEDGFVSGISRYQSKKEQQNKISEHTFRKPQPKDD